MWGKGKNALFVSECDIRVIHVNLCADKQKRATRGEISIVKRSMGVGKLLCIFLYFPRKDYFTVLKMETADSSETVASHCRRQFFIVIAKRV